MPERKKPSCDPLLLTMLICPVTGGPLELSKNQEELLSRSARLAYPIRDGIPIMIASEARQMTDTEIRKGAK